jgi:hypothetical protein
MSGYGIIVFEVSGQQFANQDVMMECARTRTVRFTPRAAFQVANQRGYQ